MPIVDAIEIQRAHDTLLSVVTGQVNIGELPFLDRMILHAALDALCWVLKHDHNKKFEENLKELRATIREAGYIEQKADAPFTLEDMRKPPN